MGMSPKFSSVLTTIFEEISLKIAPIPYYTQILFDEPQKYHNAR